MSSEQTGSENRDYSLTVQATVAKTLQQREILLFDECVNSVLAFIQVCMTLNL